MPNILPILPIHIVVALVDINNPAKTYYDLKIGLHDTVRLSRDGAKYRAVWLDVDENHTSRVMVADTLVAVVRLATTRVMDYQRI